MNVPRVAILASGNGTTAETFIKSVKSGEITADVVAVISNQKNPGIFKKVDDLNSKFGFSIKNIHIGKTNFPPDKNEEVLYGRQTKAEENAILNFLIDNDIDLVLLLGYMKLIGKSIVDEYGWKSTYKSVYEARMLNTHPGILPDTKGLYGIHVQQFALINKKPTGHCIFAVDNEYDDGPIISEHRVEALSTDTPETLFERVKESEKKFLAQDIQQFIISQQEYLK